MNKVALITGASKGIGSSTAVAFGRAGFDVVVNYRNDTKAAKKVVDEIVGFGQKAIAVQENAFTQEGIEALFTKTQSEFGRLDVLVNNAGNPKEPSFGDYDCDSVNKSLGANFGATVLCTQEAVKLMDVGCILFTSSIYGLQFGGNPNLPLYSAGKAAMLNFMQTMAEKLAPKIRCNAVAPGTTRTPAWDGVSEDYYKKSLDMNLIKEWVEPDEIADALVFLAKSPHITGQTIVVDGGWQKKIRGAQGPRRS